ncbi:MAG: porin family protein [Caulobacter sp.]|nr:porin family protein [Caulobacter sp.]
MKTLMITASAALLTATVPAMAHAEPQWYGTAGYAGADADSANLGALQGRVGVKLTPYIGFEGELGAGVKDDDVAVGAGSVNVKLNYQAAAYAVGYVPVAPNADLFARVGYGTTDFDASAGGTTFSGSDDGFAWGVGGQYYFTAKDGVRVDWTRHDLDKSGQADVLAVAYTRKF